MTEDQILESTAVGELDCIDASFSHWEQAESRSNDACHEALAAIFVESPKFENDAVRRRVLEQRVRDHPEVSRSSFFEVSEKTAAELMLTMLFGIENRKGAKSNWKAALLGAEKKFATGALERTRESFIAWIKKVGLAGAREFGKGDRDAFDFSALDDFVFNGWGIELPEPPSDPAHFPNGMAVVLVKFEKQEQGPPRPVHLGYVTKPHIIEGAARAILRIRKQEMEEGMEEMIKASGDPALLIPKALRATFDRTHFTDEDERDDFYAERRYEQAETRKRLKNIAPAKRRRRKGRKGSALPFDRHGNLVQSDPSPIAEPHELVTSTDPDEGRPDPKTSQRQFESA